MDDVVMWAILTALGFAVGGVMALVKSAWYRAGKPGLRR